MKEVVAPLSHMNVLANARGRYSSVSRRLTVLKDFDAAAPAAAGVEQDIVVSNLSGCVTELIVEAFAHDANLDRLDIRAPVTPSEVRLVTDSVECFKMESQDECRLTEYSHGYRRNDFYGNTVYRLVFGSHGVDTPKQ